MKPARMFSTAKYKGTRNYIDTQKKYELLRTVIYFGISLSLYISGRITTGSNKNLLTIVAVLGCLPACKSLVETILYFRFHSCPQADAEAFASRCTDELTTLYDMVFTTYDKNFVIGHLAVRGTTIACYTAVDKLDENACVRHLTDSLKLDGQKDITIKVFKDPHKYSERLTQLSRLDRNTDAEEAICRTFLSISL